MSFMISHKFYDQNLAHRPSPLWFVARFRFGWFWESLSPRLFLWFWVIGISVVRTPNNILFKSSCGECNLIDFKIKHEISYIVLCTLCFQTKVFISLFLYRLIEQGAHIFSVFPFVEFWPFWKPWSQHLFCNLFRFCNTQKVWKKSLSYYKNCKTQKYEYTCGRGGHRPGIRP